MQDHDIRPLYFDVAGQPMDKPAWMKAYPARVLIASTQVWDTFVCTEFVGIDHAKQTEHAPRFHSPLIYETTATLQVQGFTLARSVMWSGGFKRARVWHFLACAFACVGGVLWWRYQAYRGSDDGQDTDY